MFTNTPATRLDADTPLPDWLDDRGRIKLMTAAEIDRTPWESRRLWCHVHARYGLPTAELVEWLHGVIQGRRAIEIGSGSGDLAHHLKIKGTDNKCQTRPDVALYYTMSGQPMIRYPDWVEKKDALAAIEKYNPQVVIGSWITHWIDPRLPMPKGGGNMYGVKEDLLLDSGVSYVMIGNMETHQYKPILKLPHEEHALPFLRSRAHDPSQDRVFIWHGKR